MFRAEHTKRLYAIYTAWGVLALFFIIGLSSGTHTNTASAAGTINLTGYAWSDTPTGNPTGDRGAGWIHFDGTNYGVTEDATTGTLSGQAWSENVGWISFDESDVNGCPSGTCRGTVDQTTGLVTGWARALAHDASWDGWIHFSSGGNYGSGVVQDTSTCAWSGYAWGGSVLGWIHFTDYSGNGVKATGCSTSPPTSPTVNISADPSGFNNDTGGSITLTWTSTDATSCGDITNSNDSSTIATGGATNNSTGVTTNVTQTTIYTINCSNAGGSTTTNTNGVVTLVVSAPSNTISDFRASPSRVAKNGTSYLLWSSSGFNSCTVKDANNTSVIVPSPSTSSSGTQTPVTVIQAMTYTLSCTGADGNASATASVGLVPSFIEI